VQWEGCFWPTHESCRWCCYRGGRGYKITKCDKERKTSKKQWKMKDLKGAKCKCVVRCWSWIFKMAFVWYIFIMKQQGDVKQVEFTIPFENIDITSVSFNYATKVSLKWINKKGTCC
jgi:hypothetical protein